MNAYGERIAPDRGPDVRRDFRLADVPTIRSSMHGP